MFDLFNLIPSSSSSCQHLFSLSLLDETQEVEKLLKKTKTLDSTFFLFWMNKWIFINIFFIRWDYYGKTLKKQNWIWQHNLFFPLFQKPLMTTRVKKCHFEYWIENEQKLGLKFSVLFFKFLFFRYDIFGEKMCAWHLNYHFWMFLTLFSPSLLVWNRLSITKQNIRNNEEKNIL